VEAAAGVDVVDVVVVPEAAVVVVTPDFTPVVVLLDLLVPPHAASSRDRAPSPIEVKMLRRTGDPLAIIRSEDCAPVWHHCTGRNVTQRAGRHQRPEPEPRESGPGRGTSRLPSPGGQETGTSDNASVPPTRTPVGGVFA